MFILCHHVLRVYGQKRILGGIEDNEGGEQCIYSVRRN